MKLRISEKISNANPAFIVFILDGRLIWVRRLLEKQKGIKLIAFAFISLPDEDKCSLKRQRREHQRNTEGGGGGYESKKADKRAAKRSWEGKSREVGGQLQPRSKDAVDMLTFDFQQNLPTLNLTHQDMFYRGNCGRTTLACTTASLTRDICLCGRRRQPKEVLRK